MLKNRIEIEIEWGDCDPAGIVYYPNYFRWFNYGAHKLFGAAGLPVHEMFKDQGIVGVPLLDAKATFLSPVRFGDTITVTSEIAEWRNKSFVVMHEIHYADVLAVEGREIRAWVVVDKTRPKGLRAIPVPDEIKARFEDGG